MHRLILGFKKMNEVIVGADLSAFSGFHDISLTLLNSI